jgi:hypothetical protein
MARKSKEEFLRGFARPRGAAPEPSHTEHPKDYSQMSDQELSDAIEEQERKVREARERELAAYRELDAGEESKPNLLTELRKRGVRTERRHF